MCNPDMKIFSSNEGLRHYICVLLAYASSMYRHDDLMLCWETEALQRLGFVFEEYKYKLAETVESWIDYVYGCLVCGKDRSFEEITEMLPCECTNHVIYSNDMPVLNVNASTLTSFEKCCLPFLNAMEASHNRHNIDWLCFSNSILLCHTESRHFIILIFVLLNFLLNPDELPNSSLGKIGPKGIWKNE
jgi:hypothetical protein